MTAPTKTAKAPANSPKPKAPASKPAPKPEAAKAPEAPAPAPAPRTGNSAYAAESVRNQLHAALEKLRGEGWTRPMISRHTGFSDSQVWRGQNLKAHQAEMDTWFTFLERVTKGEIKPDAPARKPKAEDVQRRVDAALEALASEAKTVAQFRAVVAKAQEILSA